ncbi:HNH endonuclease [Bacillus phage Bastille]|uniref:Deoxyuridine 5'-triphosphate nucleotidohydrolase family protein n=2 Tax=Bastillevirus TaxID=1918010 RepID=J9PLD0_9CAUD|nr:HNH endonuclease [Bacillus phage Bastille]AEQ34392.1 deoxyuridine 5'-triphosphate nucleotidohydrolase family protein [Bacillus phage Bastille]ASU01112.1 HNH homing endonuclease [Bacillus phage Anthony]
MAGKSHGMSNTRIHTIWKNMKQRCYNPKRNKYHLYGGKGIRVCEDWHDFIPFYEWSMGNGYKEGLTIDRIDSDKDYEPSNCRWVTDTENGRRAVENQHGTSIKNKYKTVRSADVYEYKGVKKTVKEWSKESGIPIETFKTRLKHEWSIERAIEQPVRRKK